MNVLSLFDGISCGYLALQRAGIKIDTYYAAEIDRYAAAMSERNFPDIIRLGDVTKVSADNLLPIQVLIGGSPCQSFSASAQRSSLSRGFEGKSGLFYEYVRILRELQAKDPNVLFFLENVVMKPEWEKIITEEMGVEPIKINSSLVSAQNRPRLYWTNIPYFGPPEDKKIIFKDIIDHDNPKSLLGATYISRFKQEHPDNGTKMVIGSTKPEGTIGQRHVVHGVNHKISALTATDYKQPKQILENGILRKITPLEVERLQTLPDNYTSGFSPTQRYKAVGNAWTVDVIAHLFSGIKSLE